MRYVYENKLFQGTSADTFSPNRMMTRAMLVTVLYRLSGAPESNGAPDFTDVKQGDWCAEAVAWAASHGIVTGFADGRFAPNANITQEQMAAILFRYAGCRGLDTTALRSSPIPTPPPSIPMPSRLCAGPLAPG